MSIEWLSCPYEHEIKTISDLLDGFLPATVFGGSAGLYRFRLNHFQNEEHETEGIEKNNCYRIVLVYAIFLIIVAP